MWNISEISRKLQSEDLRPCPKCDTVTHHKINYDKGYIYICKECGYTLKRKWKVKGPLR